MFYPASPEVKRLLHWVYVVVGFGGGLGFCFFAFMAALHAIPGVIPAQPGFPAIPEGIQVIEVMIIAAVFWCFGAWYLARLCYEPVPALSPAYLLGARIVRSLVVFSISAAAIAMGCFITFPLSKSPLPLFGIGIMLFGLFGLYTIYRDWWYGEPAGFQKH